MIARIGDKMAESGLVESLFHRAVKVLLLMCEI